MQAWARAVYPYDWQTRCAVMSDYLVRLDEDTFASMTRKPWPDIYAAAEKEQPAPAASAQPNSEPPSS